MSASASERVTNVLLALLRVGLDPGPEAPGFDPGFDQVWPARSAEEIDAALTRLNGHRLVIEAAGAPGLNLALARLQRADLLVETETAAVVAGPVPYLAALGLPPDRAAQLEVARAGRSRLVGVIKDDSGGVCISGARLTPWTPGSDWWVRAVVDDERLCDGHVRSLTVRHVGPSQVYAEVRVGRFRRRSERGRALQLACDPAQIVADDVPRERPRSRRTFWAEPKLWRLALP